MTIHSEKNNETLTFIIEGRLDTVTSPELEKRIGDLPDDVTNLILDMKALEYISSAGLRVLLSAQKSKKRMHKTYQHAV